MGSPSWRSESTAKHTRVAKTASSNYPRKITATSKEIIPKAINDGTILVTSEASLMRYIVRRYPRAVLAHVMQRIPMKMNIPAILRAKMNLARCFKFKMKPFHALAQNPSPETAM